MLDESPNIDQTSYSSSFSNQLSSDSRQLNEQSLQGLQQCLPRIKEFISGLGEKAETPIGDMVFRFCRKHKDFQMLPKNVINLLEKRIQRMMKNRRRKKNWNSQDTKILIWTMSKYMELHTIPEIQSLTLQDWYEISKFIPGSLPESCMFKILNLKKNKLSSNKWTQEESVILSELASQLFPNKRKYRKKNWRKISEKLYIANQSKIKIFRTAKQCKQHWTCFLNPELKKGSWDISEDKALFEYVLNNEGQKRWSNLAKIIKGRTENALKNRYNIIMQREIEKYGTTDEMSIVKNYLKRLKCGSSKTTNSSRKKEEKKNGQIDEDEEVNKEMEEKEDNHYNQELQNEEKSNKEKMVQNEYKNSQEPFQNNGQYVYPIIFQNTNFFYFLPQAYL